MMAFIITELRKHVHACIIRLLSNTSLANVFEELAFPLTCQREELLTNVIHVDTHTYSPGY